jgi:hypothetical protein
MKTLFFVLAIVLFVSCGNKTDDNTTENKGKIKNEKAVKYYEEAQKLHAEFTTERDTILKAVVFLDSAIALDPEYIRAYLLKQSCQIRLGEYENALNTVKILEKLDPNNADLKSMAGIYHLLNNENKSAEIKLLQADSLWNIVLDTISSNNDWGLLHVLMNKAVVLKFLEKETEANNLFDRILTDTIFDKDSYKGIKNEIDSFYLNQSKENIYQHMLQGLKQYEYPNR